MDIPKIRSIIDLLPKTDTKREIFLKVFLADWKHALTTGLQITDIDWIYGIHGPESEELKNLLNSEYDNRPECEPSSIVAVIQKLFNCDEEHGEDSLLIESEKSSVSHVLGVTKDYGFADLIKLVYSVRPIIYSNNSHLGQIIDLPAIAANQHAEDEERLERMIA